MAQWPTGSPRSSLTWETDRVSDAPRSRVGGHGPLDLGPDGRPAITGTISLPRFDDAGNLILEHPEPGGAGETGAAPSGSRSRYARLLGKAGWNLTDQVITAVTNALLFIVLARTVQRTGELDAFTNAFYVFALLIGLERASVGQVLGVRFSEVEGGEWRTALREALGFLLALALAASAVVASVGLVARAMLDRPTLGNALLALAVVLPALVLQDACRMAFFAQSRAREATVNDALWATLQFSGIWLLAQQGLGRVPYLILAWGGSAAVCVLIALTQLHVAPDPRQARAWLNRTWDLSKFFVAENLLTAGAFNGGFLVVGAIAGEGAVSAIRGAQVLLGPMQTVQSAMFTFILPELSRRAWLGARARWTIAGGASVVMLTMALTYTTLLWLMPDSIGRAIFRTHWDGPESVLVPVALGMASAGACLGPAVTIYAMGLARKTFRLMTIEAPLVLTLLIGGALAGGVVGAAWGLALNQSLLLPLWFLQLRSVLNPPGRPTPRGRHARDEGARTALALAPALDPESEAPVPRPPTEAEPPQPFRA